MTDQEKDLIENLEHNGFYNTALSLRKFLATQNRDANAGCENPGAMTGDRWIDTRDGSLKEWDGCSWRPLITPEQARYAYDHAIHQDHRTPDDPGYRTSTANQQLYAAFRPIPHQMMTGQQTAQARPVPCDLSAEAAYKRYNEAYPEMRRHMDAERPITAIYEFDPADYSQKAAKHHFITLSGTPRREPCCL